MLTTIINVFFIFFRLLFKILFYDLLVFIYFKIFRFKKNELAGLPLKKVLTRETTRLIILVFTFILVIINFIPSQGIKTASAKLSQTVASNLIVSDFDTNIDEAFIEEKLSPAIIASIKQPKLIQETVIEKEVLLDSDGEIINPALLILSEDSDVILKPQGLFEPNTENPDIAERTEIIEYTVQLGDTVSSIANRFGLTVNTVLWANNLGNYSLIRPGNDLIIPPASGLLYSVKSGDTLSNIAKTYKIEASEISKQNNLEENASLKIKQQLLLPGATKLAAVVSRPVSRPVISSPGSTAKTAPASLSGGSMVWPADSRRITQYFSWAHNGLDIANKSGTAIYAAEAGTIDIAATGWNGGYGNTILINHGGGKKTRYGHLTTLYVKVGDKVERGENIGTMGSTGRSTGPHLHFEVIINGTRYNPLNYIK